MHGPARLHRAWACSVHIHARTSPAASPWPATMVAERTPKRKWWSDYSRARLATVTPCCVCLVPPTPPSPSLPRSSRGATTWKPTLVAVPAVVPSDPTTAWAWWGLVVVCIEGEVRVGDTIYAHPERAGVGVSRRRQGRGDFGTAHIRGSREGRQRLRSAAGQQRARQRCAVSSLIHTPCQASTQLRGERVCFCSCEKRSQRR